MISKKVKTMEGNLLKKSLSLKEYQTSGQLDFKYIWQASIPESWTKIMQKKNIRKFQLSKQSRNTLEFLEETQKYISKICLPEKSKDPEILPTSCRSADKFHSLSRKTLESIPEKLLTRRSSGQHKPNILKSQLSLLLRKNKSQMDSPVLSENRALSEKHESLNNKY